MEIKGLSFPVTSNGVPPDSYTIKSWKECTRDDKKNVLIYILLMYDKNSPLLKKSNNLEFRKNEALHLAGFNSDDPRLSTYKEFIDEEFTTMVIDFLIYQNDYVWMMLVSNEQTFYEFQKTLLQESAMIRNDKDKISAIASKAKLMEESDNIVNRIAAYRKKVFSEDKLIDESKKIAVSPEEMARM